MKHIIITSLAASAALVSFAAWDSSVEDQVACQLNGKDVWRFCHNSETATKSFFDPLRVADGPSLTWARPADHVWHYGLWFSWKFINSVNYWEETGGKSDGTTRASSVVVKMNNNDSATVTMSLDYFPKGKENETVLTEQRTIDISAPAEDGSYFMDWTMTLTAYVDVKFDRTPIPGEPNGMSWGGYSGLSMRFADGMKDTQTISTAGRVQRNKDDRLDTTAAAVEQNGIFADGKPYGVAILAHPSNPRAPGDWYSLEDGHFTFFNAAFLLKAPYTLAKGETLTLRYRVHIHSGRWDAEKLNQAQTDYSNK